MISKVYFRFLPVTTFILALVANIEVSIGAEDPGDPVYLTPLIKDGRIDEAQDAALVGDFRPLLSYSGLITVNESAKSNIFFWFFPAETSYDEENNLIDNDLPVILWSDGGPGISAFFSIFGQNGPFNGEADGVNYTLNPFSWHKNYHMIYMDNPVEVGFSHTESGYITSGPEAAVDIYEFLSQFFALFPHLQRNPFYNAGASYGATYATQTAFYIHQKNLDNPAKRINLTGLIVDSPWIDPYTQSIYGEYLFNAGLINEAARDELIENEAKGRSLIDEGNYLEAFRVTIQITQMRSLNLTGYSSLQSIFTDNIPWINMTEFAVLNSTRKALHVGGLDFKLISPEQQSRMHPNFMRSSKPQLETLLDEGYKFLLYVGNMDGSTGHLGVQSMLKSLTWPGGKELVNQDREIWKVKDKIAGYRTSSGNATMVIIRNAGHGCSTYKPEEVLDAISTFMK